MFETNTQNNSALISLARAAEITGYHQDYLGQLCRLGRLQAKKVGRNWFTSQEALKQITAAPVIDTETVEDITPPDLVQAVTISQVEGLPIALRTFPRPIQRTNTVQSIVTNLRIESLQKEVLELRAMLNRLMAEVTKHANLLEGRVAPDFKHSYASNFDFNIPTATEESTATDTPVIIALERSEMHQHTRPAEYSIVTWLAATTALFAITFIGLTMISGDFFGSKEPQVQTVYYHPTTTINEQPEVAGAATEPLPPENIDQQGLNVVQ